MYYRNRQSGQTLIETITAIFVLTMALSSGLGLAIYASSNSLQAKNQIIAENLAVEGIEVARMFRDTNWLSAENLTSVQDLYETGGGCDFPTSNSGSGTVKRPCYPEAFTEPYSLRTGPNDNYYRVVFRSNDPTNWDIESVSGKENYLLCLQSDGMYRSNDPGSSGISCTDPGTAQFARRVVIRTGNTSFPFTGEPSGNPAPTGTRAQNFGGHSPEKIIVSYVVWQGRRCTPFPSNMSTFDPAVFVTPCKVAMTERISNWKDYR